MAKRKIIKIVADKCTGCGLCIPNCPEGALQIIDGKARLISDLFCDGLGACLGHCPEDAIIIEEREAEKYDEKKVMANIAAQGKNTVKAHLIHLRDHGEKELLRQAIEYLTENNPEINVPELVHGEEGHEHGGGCPGSRMQDLRRKSGGSEAQMLGGAAKAEIAIEPEIQNWPVQIMLVPVHAPYFNGADLLIAADCVPFAYPKFHQDLLKGKILLIGCPKLDDNALYAEKLGQIIKENDIKSVTVAHMEVPCCFGLLQSVEAAIETSGKNIAMKEATIGIKGNRID
ncbi:MAG: 4Fe-4S ferredoxin [Candidatus Firestonebacteria bacterium RIFOXYC2_FULL_39_67]|nr:MAG: 4Fe-4S ferredoxin [Candidatus Firestonebacteria bacterium RIFOXYD2_FULL_39_29]OGF55427.1 MAG: 4Fe-4S ferredoxin [Candidatus Firestonebacteria bacterium RIFOXYC2_FULL_39_67]